MNHDAPPCSAERLTHRGKRGYPLPKFVFCGGCMSSPILRIVRRNIRPLIFLFWLQFSGLDRRRVVGSVSFLSDPCAALRHVAHGRAVVASSAVNDSRGGVSDGRLRTLAICRIFRDGQCRIELENRSGRHDGILCWILLCQPSNRILLVFSFYRFHWCCPIRTRGTTD